MPPDKNGNGNGFQRELKAAEWRGYTLKALQNLDDEVKEVRIDIRELDKRVNENCDKLDTKMDKINDNVNALYIKVAGIGATVALLVSIALKLLKV